MNLRQLYLLVFWLVPVLVAIVVPLHVIPGGNPAAGVGDIPQSDSFDSWSPLPDGHGASFQASPMARHGAWALRIQQKATGKAVVPSVFSQVLPVVPGEPLEMTFAVRSFGTSAGAVRLQVDGSITTSLSVPQGSYGWRKVRWRYHMPRRSPSLGIPKARLQITVSGPVAGVEIDDMSARAGGRSVLRNGGFELNSRELTISNSSLVFVGSAARLHLLARSQPAIGFRWKLVDSRGKRAASGSGKTRAGVGAIDIFAAPGYYRLQLRWRGAGRANLRSTNLVFLTRLASKTSPLTSVGVHFNGVDSKVFARQVHDLAALGIRNLRTDISWAAVESSPGRYVFPRDIDERLRVASAAGIGSLLIADYSNPLYDDGKTPSSSRGIAAYARFVAALALHYPRASIDVYNEFNYEFNTGRCGRTPQCYLELLRPTRDAVRRVSRQTKISAPSIAGDGVNGGWIRQFFAGGGLQYTDAVSIHPYQHNSAPDRLEERLSALRSAISAVGRRNPIWLTEFGYTTSTGAVSEAAQAAYLLRITAIVRRTGVQRLYWYDAFDDSVVSGDRESNFGLFRQPTSLAPNAWVPKPAAAAEGVAARLLSGRRAVSSSPSNSAVRTYSFSGKRPLRVVWSTRSEASVAVQTGQRVYSDTGALVRAVVRGTSRVVSVGVSPVYMVG